MLQPQVGECLDEGSRAQIASRQAQVRESRSNTRRPSHAWCCAVEVSTASIELLNIRAEGYSDVHFQYKKHHT